MYFWYNTIIISTQRLISLTCREWKRKAESHSMNMCKAGEKEPPRPPLEEKEMMKIFINTLKNLTLTTCWDYNYKSLQI